MNNSKIKKILSKIEEIKNKVNKIDVPYSFAERRLGDVPSIVADNKLAIKTLNWFPKRDLSAMCKDGWQWQINNPKGYD